jgi:hypothetical protein
MDENKIGKNTSLEAIRRRNLERENKKAEANAPALVPSESPSTKTPPKTP